MAVYLSTALRNAMLNGVSMAAALNKGVIDIYSGPQPANADAAPTGTKLVRITPSSAAYVLGVAATNVVTSNNTDVSNNDYVEIAGLRYTFKTALTPADREVLIAGTADGSLTNLANAINGTGGTNGTDYQVAAANAYVSAGAVAAHAITLTALDTGTAGNYIGLAKSAVTLSVTGALFTGGVNGVGLSFEAAAAGVLAKATGEVWSGIGLAAGTAGWARFKGNATDADGVSTTLARLDCSVANSGADMLMANTSVTVSAPVTLDVWSYTLPAT